MNVQFPATRRRLGAWSGAALCALLVAGCATMGDSLRVAVVGVEPLQGEGF